jgi:CRP-like cAMP-binding protein
MESLAGMSARSLEHHVHAAKRNRLLAKLKAEELVPIAAACELVTFSNPAQLARIGDPISTVYFPIDGYASLTVSDEEQSGIQVALVGVEGVLGWETLLGTEQFVLGIDVPESSLALCLSVHEFKSKTSEMNCWRTSLMQYIAGLVGLAARNVLCTRFHVLEARLARCLLEIDDRHLGVPIRLTQGTLAQLLGVRRSGVTNAATDLQLRGLIHYRRGEISLLDRPGLEAVACSCYRVAIG